MSEILQCQGVSDPPTNKGTSLDHDQRDEKINLSIVDEDSDELVGLKKTEVSPGAEIRDEDLAFPEGGLQAWLVVIGVCTTLCCVQRTIYTYF